MQISARIIHGGTESTFASFDDTQTAQFFTYKACEWANGRRHGEFECHADNGTMVVRFADITAFSVELKA